MVVSRKTMDVKKIDLCISPVAIINTKKRLVSSIVKLGVWHTGGPMRSVARGVVSGEIWYVFYLCIITQKKQRITPLIQ